MMINETIPYTVAGSRYSGELVYEPNVGRRPAILMAPNWMGVRAEAVERAKLIGEGRYAVFVVDMFGEGRRPKNFDEAALHANPLRADPDEARRRMLGALAAFIEEGGKRDLIEPKRMAAVGFCFGGGNVLELARAGADVAAVVAIHADLVTPKPAKPGDIKAGILVVHGTIDPVTPKAHRDAFEQEMDEAKTNWQMLLFGGLLHAYTDMGNDIPGVARYHESASRQTYEKMHSFIADAFAGRL